MEGSVDDSYLEAKKRAVKERIRYIRETVENTNNYTSFNVQPKFTPAEVETLLNHIDACHKILFELSEVNDYELPYRTIALIEQAVALRRAVS